MAPSFFRLARGRMRVLAWGPEPGDKIGAEAARLAPPTPSQSRRRIHAGRRSLHNDVPVGEVKHKNMAGSPTFPLRSNYKPYDCSLPVLPNLSINSLTLPCRPLSSLLRTRRDAIPKSSPRIPSASGKPSTNNQHRLKRLRSNSAITASRHRVPTVRVEVRFCLASRLDAVVLTSPLLPTPFSSGLQVTTTENRNRLPAKHRSVNFWANG